MRSSTRTGPVISGVPAADLPPKSATYYHFALWRDDGTDRMIHELLRCQAREKAGPPPSDAAHVGTVPVLWLCGPPSVGKSTIGFEVFRRVLGDGVPAAYIDLAQIGFCLPTPDDDPDHHRLKAHHLGRVWEGFRAAGARCLIMSGTPAGSRAARAHGQCCPDRRRSRSRRDR